jgi:nucleoid DNA-binding protein
MDIAKYIGLFLLKNEYCYLPGIGSLQVVKKAAGYDPELQQMNAPVYAVEFERAAGSIDDSFANFIANNERISIAHASNYLKDFCARAKQDLKENKEIIIPGIGKFISDSNQKIGFIADPHLQIKGRAIPFFKNNTGAEQKREDPLTRIIERTSFKEPKGDEEIVMQPPQVNWPKIIILILVVLGVLAGIFFVFNWSKKSRTDQTEKQSPAIDTPVTDNAPVQAPDVAAPPVVSSSNNASTNGTVRISINQYPSYDAAKHRMDQLASYGNKVEIWTRDSVSYSVTMRFSDTIDRNGTIDSLKRLFNPGGQVMVVE